MRLGDYLAGHRITQDAFAQRVGTRATNVNKWVNGRTRPSLLMAARIAAATGGQVTAADFVPAEAERAA
jgi:DNA-binding transcriptional regulator YdaS (Cro superfamily)